MLDLRVPSGSFFTLLGVILLGMGIFAPECARALTDVNVNLYCGAGMLVFGALPAGDGVAGGAQPSS